MDDHEESIHERRERWWFSQRDDFGLPGALYAPLPVAILLVIALGLGCAFVGLFPGVDTRDVTLSGAGAPWIGLLVLSVVSMFWQLTTLKYAFSSLWVGIMLAVSVVLVVGVSLISVNVLAEEWPDPFIGGMGILWLLGGLLLLMGFLFDGFLLSLLMGAMMGAFLGVMSAFVISFEAVLIMVAIYLPVGALAGGIAGALKPLIKPRLKRVWR